MYFCGVKKTQQFMNFSISRKISLGILIATANFCFAQDKAEAALKKFEENYPQEKIHLLFNKDLFISGDQINFKSYVMEGYEISKISTTLFVELYDQQKKQIDKKIIALVGGEGSGTFKIPTDLKEGIYYIRAYTTWMTNFSEDYNFLKPIPIYNPASPQKVVEDTNATISATVHPEGGGYFEDKPAKFSVRLHSKGILPKKWSGTVSEINNPNVALAQFESYDENVGLFNFTAKKGEKYLVTVNEPSGKKSIAYLPEATKSDLRLIVESKKDEIRYSFQSAELPSANTYKVIATINNQLVYKAKFNKIFENGWFSIPTDKLVNGILTLTLFDSNEKEISQRLCFVQNDVLKIKETNIEFVPNFSKRAVNNLLFNETKEIDYNILITDAESKNAEEDNSFLSSLWLTGDLRSKISRPAQYFNDERNPSALDALLISEKWERFNWNNIIQGIYPPIKNKPEPYLSYKFKVLSQGRPIINSDVNLIFRQSDEGNQFRQIKTDESGYFYMKGLVFSDKLQFSYQLNTTNEDVIRNTQIFSQPLYSFIPLKKELPASGFKMQEVNEKNDISVDVTKSVANLKTEKLFSEKFTEIEEVNIKGKKISPAEKLNNELSSPLFNSYNQTLFDFVSSPQFGSDIITWLIGRVPGLRADAGELFLGQNSINSTNNRIESYIDENRVPTASLQNISISDIALVKVIKGFYGGGRAGAVVVYTRRGSMAFSNNYATEGLHKVILKGYDNEEPFKNTVFENIRPETIAEDNRTTLYWNSALKIHYNSSEKNALKFYNNDHTKKLKIWIIGFDKEDMVPYYTYKVIE